MVETFVQSTGGVVKFLKGQHNLIKDLFEEVLSASSDEAREKAFVEVRQLLAVHETAEEMVVPGRRISEAEFCCRAIRFDARSGARRHPERIAVNPTHRSTSQVTGVTPGTLVTTDAAAIPIAGD